MNEALEKLVCGNFDIALIDLIVPGRSGLELLEAIQGGGLAVVPILLSGTADVYTAVAGMKSGAFEYLPKPVDLDELGFAIKRALIVAHTRRQNRALECAVAEWEATFDACPDVLLILGPDGRVLRANEATVCRAGLDRGRPVGRSFSEIFPSALGAAIRGTPLDEAVHDVVVFDPLLDAHFLSSVIPFQTAPTTRAVVVAVREVTRIVRAEDERKRLLGCLVSAQEDERRRLARELHDGVGQALVTVVVGLASTDGADRAGPIAECVSRLQQVAADSLEEVRRLAHGLRPASLDDLGLIAALARLAEVFTRVHGIRAELLVTDPLRGRLQSEVESVVYRLVQESLANVAKHAREPSMCSLRCRRPTCGCL